MKQSTRSEPIQSAHFSRYESQSHSHAGASSNAGLDVIPYPTIYLIFRFSNSGRERKSLREQDLHFTQNIFGNQGATRASRRAVDQMAPEGSE